MQSQLIPQEGRPNRKQYAITEAGKDELRRWVSTPLPLEAKREAWLIQIFFAHGVTNADIARLIEKRIEAIRAQLAQYEIVQATIDENDRQVGVERLRQLWQLTLDYGINHYENEIAWLEKILPRVRDLPEMEPPRTPGEG